MSSNITSPGFSRITDDASLMDHSADSPYIPYSPYLDSPELPSDRYYQIPATEVYSFLESTPKPVIRGSPKRPRALNNTFRTKAETHTSKESSLSYTHEDPIELQKVGSSIEKSDTSHILGTDGLFAEPTTLSSSKSSSDLLIAIIYFVFCLPFCFVLVYVGYLNGKPVNERWWTYIQRIRDAVCGTHSHLFISR